MNKTILKRTTSFIASLCFYSYYNNYKSIKKSIQRTFKIIVICSFFGIYQTPVMGQSTEKPNPFLITQQEWKEDINYLIEKLELIHPAPYRKISQSDLRKKLNLIVNNAKENTPTHNGIALIETVSSLGDGHTRLRLSSHPAFSYDKTFPVNVYPFEDGVFIVVSNKEHENLLGAEIQTINGMPVDKAVGLLSELIPFDNEFTRLSNLSTTFSNPEMLLYKNIINNTSEMLLKVKLLSGEEKLVTIKSIPSNQWKRLIFKPQNISKTPLHMQNQRKSYWFKYLPEQKLLYFQFNRVRNQGEESFQDFNTRLWRFVANNEIDKFVLDIRSNSGGNSNLLQPLIHGIIKNEKINQQGKLFTLIGRSTFSSGGICAVLMEKHTKTLFIGEPMGGGINHFGNTRWLRLPNSKMLFRVSKNYFVNTVPHELRSFIMPDIPAPYKFTDFNEGKDPALEAINDLSSNYVFIKDLFNDKSPEEVRNWVINQSKEFAWWKVYREKDLNSIGLDYLASGNIDKAKVLLELNTLLYPNSYNVWDSMGEFFLTINNLESAKTCYQKSMKLNQAHSPESSINSFGHRLISKGEMNSAFHVFKMNTEMFPTSANVWDSFAGINLQLKKFSKALELYNKSFELDPHHVINNPYRMINRTASEFAKKKDPKSALAALKLNTELFSDSANAWFAMAKAQLEILNKKVIATKSLEKALKIDPKNQKAIELLNKIKKNRS